MNFNGTNHPFVVWGTCFLWLTSMFCITWSLLLFFCVGDILMLSGTDLVNALVLLSGIIMLPTNVHMLCTIANGKKIDCKAKVVCCPLWLCIVWIIIINMAGIILSIQRIVSSKEITARHIANSMVHYRSVPKYKHFMDNLQWSLKCCGLNSYKDWFNRDWYDKIRDYEWDPSANKRKTVEIPRKQTETTETDSVPLSCCKSGSCISNYLLELGTSSINTNGCGELMLRIVRISMICHIILFLSIIIVEIVILKIVKSDKQSTDPNSKRRKVAVRHLLSAKNNFDTSSSSYQLNQEDSDD